LIVASRLALVALVFGVVAVVWPGRSAAPRARGPNIVLLMTDDMRADDLARMPATRRLIAAGGATFTRAYVSFPLCCPSRATLNSGQYAHNHGVRGNGPPRGGFQALTDRDNLLATWLQAVGYYTVHIGKYLNGYGTQEPARPQPGWSDWRGAIDGWTYLMWGYRLLEHGQPVTYGDREVEDPALYQTDVYRGKAEAIIRERAASGRPFYLDLAFLAPHQEYIRRIVRSAPRHRGLLATAPLPHPPAFDERSVADKPRWLRAGAPRLSPARIARITDEYRHRQESLLAVDEAVARLVAVLEETGQLENTFVVFTSDNGYFQGEHRIANGKSLPYEPSVRVPLLIRGPGIPAGVRSAEPVANVDLAPTFAAIAGAMPRRVLDGRSLLPFARDPARRSARPLLLEGGRTPSNGRRFPAPPYRGIVAGHYKYVVYADGSRELYDLARDPQELRNRVDDRGLHALRRALARRLETLRSCRGRACRAKDGLEHGPLGDASVARGDAP
jgi:N-acetylglucosamine-6-sulfatase